MDEVSGGRSAARDPDVAEFLTIMSKVPRIGEILRIREVLDRGLDLEEVVRLARAFSAIQASARLTRCG